MSKNTITENTNDLKFEAVADNLHELESKFVDNLIGEDAAVVRRSAFALLCKSSEHFADKQFDEGTLNAFVQIAECVGEQLSKFESFVEMLKAAQVRAMIVLQQQLNQQQAMGV